MGSAEALALPAEERVLDVRDLPATTPAPEIKIGGSCYSDDVWDLKPLLPKKRKVTRYVKFSIAPSAQWKDLMKKYVYYRLGKVKPQSLAREVAALSAFMAYAEEWRIPGCDSLIADDFVRFADWLEGERCYSEETCRLYYSTALDFVGVSQMRSWASCSAAVVPRARLELDRWARPASEKLRQKTKPIPMPVFNQILRHAVHDEEDPVTGALIKIQSQTGLRISEVISIQEGCLRQAREGYWYFTVTIEKTERGDPVKHNVFANELVCEAIRRLEAATEDLRREAGVKDLFVARGQKRARGTIRCITTDDCRTRLIRFVEKWDIRGDDGSLYPLRSHQFRATFVREAVKGNAPIRHVMEQYEHASVEMTMHYLTLRQDELREIYADMILRPDAKIAGLRAKLIKEEVAGLMKGRIEEDVDSAIMSLADMLSFNPLPTGVCLYDVRRGNCTDGDGCFFYNCPNFVTGEEFYPTLRRELELLEREMDRFRELGRERDWQRRHVKHRCLKPIVDDLERQMDV